MQDEDDANDPLYPESMPTDSSIQLDKQFLSTLLNKSNVEVPQKFSDLQLNFTREEKLLIYQHVVNCVPNKAHKQINLLLEQEEEFKEMVAKLKREKKKCHKFRTMKPTYIEELRAVIEMQMQAYKKCKHNKTKCQNQHKKTSK